MLYFHREEAVLVLLTHLYPNIYLPSFNNISTFIGFELIVQLT